MVSIQHYGHTFCLCCFVKVEHTVDQEIFMLKIIRVKIFRGVKFSRFRSICKKFLMVDSYNRDVCLERS